MNLWGSGHRPHANDVGVGSRVGHEEIAWAKLQALSAGAGIASDYLWKR